MELPEPNVYPFDSVYFPSLVQVRQELSFWVTYVERTERQITNLQVSRDLIRRPQSPGARSRMWLTHTGACFSEGRETVNSTALTLPDPGVSR